MENRESTDAQIMMPDQSVFGYKKDVISTSIMGKGAIFHIFDRVEYPPEGGIYLYYKGLPYPKKGFPFPEAVWHNDMAKRMTLTFLRAIGTKDMLLPMASFALLPWKIKMRVISTALQNWSRTGDWILRNNYLLPERYSKPVQVIRKALKVFLEDLGFGSGKNLVNIEEVVNIISTIIEYDDAYRYRLEDLASEAVYSALLHSPVTELRRLAKIYAQREKTHANESVASIMRIATLILLHPKIRKAFKKSILSVDVEWKDLCLDQADKYHVLLRDDYNFGGFSIEERKEAYAIFHKEKNIPFPPILEIAP